MTPPVGDLYPAFYAQLETLDRIFEFWIAITFGVITATFFAGSRISNLMYGLISILYGLVSLNLMARSYVAGLKVFELSQQLVDAGEYLPAGYWNLIIAALTMLAFIGGTIGTIYFIWHTYKSGHSEPIDDSE